MTGMVTAERASAGAGVPLHLVKKACRNHLVFCIWINGEFWLPPEALAELDLIYIKVKTTGSVASRPQKRAKKHRGGKL